jgi:hypothetical protein
MTTPTFADKLRTLLENRDKLVLVQQHELERIRENKSKSDIYRPYVDSLYEHYIVNKQPRLYLSF